MPTITREEAAAERARAGVQRSHRPSARRDRSDQRTAPCSPYRAAAAATPPLRAQLSVERSASTPADDVTLRGYATSYEQPYEMYDMWGPYTEVVTAGAGEATLNRNPDVKFLFNHRDMPMARTLDAGTLQLTEDDHGLLSVAQPLMSLSISQQVVSAIEARLIDEMSFAFYIVRGAWSPDWTEYRIHEYDIHRGDTSAVTYGANPFTDIAVEREQAATAARSHLTPAERATARRLAAGHLART
jgi:Escherichia/Staphylococcus phage prohead protease